MLKWTYFSQGAKDLHYILLLLLSLLISLIIKPMFWMLLDYSFFSGSWSFKVQDKSRAAVEAYKIHVDHIVQHILSWKNVWTHTENLDCRANLANLGKLEISFEILDQRLLFSLSEQKPEDRLFKKNSQLLQQQIHVLIGWGCDSVPDLERSWWS